MLPFSKEELDQAIAEKTVTQRDHPVYPLAIYNYTPTVQYNRDWTDVTRTCRGLILDVNTLEIVGRPFPKFYNYGEVVPDPIIFGKPPVVSDKADGSLGIIYKTPDGYEVATRGSFGSEQALWATKWLRETHPDYTQPDGVTTLVEIVGPQNRIVLYYEVAELILLTAINNETGADIGAWEIDWWPGSRTEIYYDLKDVDSAYHFANTHDWDNKEGLVLCWPRFNQPSYRLKVKNAEYIRLHSIVTEFSVKKVWEALANEMNFVDLLYDVPDEFYDLVKEIQGDLLARFNEIELEAKAVYSTLTQYTQRKEFAQHAQKTKYPSIMFSMLDNKNYNKIIWKLLEPKEEKT